MPLENPWLSTDEVAQRIGMSPEWVRRQIVAGRLRATVFRTGKRPTYRIHRTGASRVPRRVRTRRDRPRWVVAVPSGRMPGRRVTHPEPDGTIARSLPCNRRVNVGVVHALG